MLLNFGLPFAKLLLYFPHVDFSFNFHVDNLIVLLPKTFLFNYKLTTKMPPKKIALPDQPTATHLL